MTVHDHSHNRPVSIEQTRRTDIAVYDWMANAEAAPWCPCGQHMARGKGEAKRQPLCPVCEQEAS